MENSVTFHKILTDLNLGSFKLQPQRVSGGYMHKMYCLETTTGKYAIKLLNPAIMKRPDVFRNYQRAERLERVLQENKMPIVPAMEINGRKMQCIENQYYYVFPWVEGRALHWDEIKKEHCKIAGELLAKIHKIEQFEKPFVRDEICIDWGAYIATANTECPEIAGKLNSCREILYSCQKEFNMALKKIPAVTCISNGDMDCKNILWVDGNPFIIDLECLDYGNPFWDMFQLALSWSGNVNCSIDFELLKAFIVSYHEEYGNVQVDWETLYGSGFGWLEWLEYNIKRALMIECTDEEERKLGISEVHETIHRIVYYHSIKEKLLHNFTTIFC
ncbi:phosphotransferase [Paenibacillus tarimensis]